MRHKKKNHTSPYYHKWIAAANVCLSYTLITGSMTRELYNKHTPAHRWFEHHLCSNKECAVRMLINQLKIKIKITKITLYSQNTLLVESWVNITSNLTAIAIILPPNTGHILGRVWLSCHYHDYRWCIAHTCAHGYVTHMSIVNGQTMRLWTRDTVLKQQW